MKAKDYRRQMEDRYGTSGDPQRAVGATSPAISQEETWTEAIRLLSDPEAGPKEKIDALQTLHAATFLVDAFAPFQAKYTEALRTVVDDTSADADLRRTALDILTNYKDEFARRKLIDGLTGKGEAVVSASAALGLLARDDHSSAAEIAKNVLKESKNLHTREQAVRVLGADPGSAELLKEVLKDKSEFKQVRQAGAVALRGLDEEQFESSAAEILADADDFEDIKSTVGGALERAKAKTVTTE